MDKNDKGHLRDLRRHHESEDILGPLNTILGTVKVRLTFIHKSELSGNHYCRLQPSLIGY